MKQIFPQVLCQSSVPNANCTCCRWGICLSSYRRSKYGSHMKKHAMVTKTPLAFILVCVWSTHLMAHPTNGYECTTMTDPIQCFRSDGFCEWVASRCLYRCDIHDGLEDCGQIKEGCRWTGSECIAEPTAVDQYLPRDVQTLMDADQVDSDLTDQNRDIDEQVDGALPQGDATSNPDTATVTSTHPEAVRTTNCSQSNSPGIGFVLLILGGILRRRIRCL